MTFRKVWPTKSNSLANKNPTTSTKSANSAKSATNAPTSSEIQSSTIMDVLFAQTNWRHTSNRENIVNMKIENILTLLSNVWIRITKHIKYLLTPKYAEDAVINSEPLFWTIRNVKFAQDKSRKSLDIWKKPLFQVLSAISKMSSHYSAKPKPQMRFI